MISTKLKAGDCEVLKEKILHRIKGWSNKTLTYGGRALLIRSVLFSIQVYWSTMFILPSKLVKEIESSLMAFLWSGLDLKHSGAKGGGLRFRMIKDWNKTYPCLGIFGLCVKKLILCGLNWCILVS